MSEFDSDLRAVSLQPSKLSNSALGFVMFMALTPDFCIHISWLEREHVRRRAGSRAARPTQGLGCVLDRALVSLTVSDENAAELV